MTSFQYYYQFQYTFTVQPSPFDIKLLGNEAVIYSKQKVEKAGMHQLRVTADLFYMDKTLACRTIFKVYIDVSRFNFWEVTFRLYISGEKDRINVPSAQLQAFKSFAFFYNNNSKKGRGSIIR